MPALPILALCFASGSTTLVSLAYLREHGAVSELPALSLRAPLRSARLLLSSRAWLLGFGMETQGFGMYVGALSLAPLALVQIVAAGGVGILAFATGRPKLVLELTDEERDQLVRWKRRRSLRRRWRCARGSF